MPSRTVDESILRNLADKCISNGNINKDLYSKYNVNIGLRDLNGKGVLTGLTDISEIRQNKIVDGKVVQTDGYLFYRGINVENLIKGCYNENRFGFEEVIYLLLFGSLPSKSEYEEFMETLYTYRSLPKNFVRDVIMKTPTKDIMNSLAKSVLTLSSYDKDLMNTSIENVLEQCLRLISLFPLLAGYSYQAYNHAIKKESLYIYNPKSHESTAEVILKSLRPSGEYTELEAKVLDLALILHAEHGGGNNSTFTTCVVTSTGTDTYSAIAAALCSLKGPKHGGANIKVMNMIKDLKKNVNNWNDEDELSDYLNRILEKQAFDKSGLIYGIGHAVYSKSDPRARVFKSFVRDLAHEKGRDKEFELYDNIERLAPVLISKKRKMYKGVSANVDFYSGFVYKMLGLPVELYTPIFAVARIAGWSAHRIEELINVNKVIRPAYIAVCEEKDYIPMEERAEQ